MRLNVPSKPLYKSKTFWFNVLMFAIEVIGIIIASAAQLELSTKTVAWLSIIVSMLHAAGNIFFRVQSYQPVSLTGSQSVSLVVNHAERSVRRLSNGTEG